MNLRECLEEYRNLTLKLIENLKDERDLDLLIEKRQQVLEVISGLIFDKDEFEEIATSLNIIELDNQLVDLVSQEKIQTKEKLDNLKKLRVARKNYNSMPSNPVIFSTKL